VKLFDDFYLLSSVVLSLSLWHTKTPHFLNSIPYCLTNGVQFISFMDIFVVHPLSSEGKPIRIVKFQIPAAVTAIPTGWKNRFYGRVGESLVDLSQEKIDRIRGERRTDWTREIIDGVSLSHLDTKAVSIARTNYRERLSNAANSNAVEELDKMDDYQFLSKIKLIRNGKITKAAFVLLGNSDYSDFFEVPPQIMWRLYDHKGNTIDHEIFDIPFLCAIDSVYKKIRNLTYRYMPNQLSLFPTETQQYDSWLLRELLNNCIAHQDYTADRRIYVDEFEDRIVISNAGQFLPGNIKTVLEPAYAPPYYRNPLLAQAMVNFKMIDTASMGIRRVYSIQKEKLIPMPDYDLSRYDQVRVTVYGKVLNDNYTKILFENPNMDLDTVYLLDRVQKGENISRMEAAALRKLGLIEGKIPKLFVSATVAEALDQKAQYIKNKGFDDQYYKQLIVDYLNKWGKGQKSDFDKLLFDKLPDSLTAVQKNTKIRNLLASLRMGGIIETDSENHQRSNWVLTKK
ncbi:ATP-binding protein, partial [Faecalibacterium duncaniae]|uniref:ATP-binding protein n=1 Tax=Faecalibacterium duncaniae (strain DSM 17677 / JCM 31915 / A2-165) TaxID=411483 RepID=UPI003EDB4F57